MLSALLVANEDHPPLPFERWQRRQSFEIILVDVRVRLEESGSVRADTFGFAPANKA